MTNNLQKMMHLLPVDAYTSQEWFDHEQQMIFSRTWQFAGFVEDIKEAGDYITVQAGLNNIFIIMGKDGELRAFHNMCRHRGTQLLRAAGKGGKAITCPYHDWTYNFMGDLVAVPEQKEEFANIDKKCHGLKPASVGIWRGMLFVHPEPNAMPVQQWFAPIEPHLGPHKVEELVEYPDTSTTDEIKANWKIVVENYIDVYHLSHLHSGTLSMYNHKKAEYGFHGPHYAFREPLSESYAKDINKNVPYPLIVPKDQLSTWVPMLFPGLGLGESECTWSTFHIIPLAPNLTRVETRTRLKDTSSWEFTKQGWSAAKFWKGKIRGKYNTSQNADDPMTSGDFMIEDIYACEQQQKSLQSPYFETGPASSKGEQPILEHQKLILEWLKKVESK
ncbi:MAG: aromatic ring-hydroxylating oxygenase subunit alpha [Alphaproteobacteria bacterium]